MGKYAFVILCNPADLSESIKAAHALHYAVQLKRKGHDVLVYFDGLGSKIPIESGNSPYRGLRAAYDEAYGEGIIYGVCGYCASPPHLNIRDAIAKLNIRLLGDEEHHEDLSMFIERGYEVLVF
ncbi:hypothetical protein [Vulcanisaeta thermophila]|uniref:hypothetical protein n=1 Tax=Vulcanisaeta thermophila TaxID=867917 RepID=UPI00085370E2|nr:hypothetical protein [Vulcanisaeta thermophila]